MSKKFICKSPSHPYDWYCTKVTPRPWPIGVGPGGSSPGGGTQMPWPDFLLQSIETLHEQQLPVPPERYLQLAQALVDEGMYEDASATIEFIDRQGYEAEAIQGLRALEQAVLPVLGALAKGYTIPERSAGNAEDLAALRTNISTLTGLRPILQGGVLPAAGGAPLDGISGLPDAPE